MSGDYTLRDYSDEIIRRWDECKAQLKATEAQRDELLQLVRDLLDALPTSLAGNPAVIQLEAFVGYQDTQTGKAK